ncbi:MAG: GNAT family N-acetyltransferase [Anaerolineae bacterium]|nr:GNAT family N-acetyltransferase [Candidatus Roseilinea sp.]MDW8448830.1 GNAT family N-acetyltransferase [Anaerolineae bacterium]
MWSFDDGDAALLLTPLDLAETDALDATRAAVAWLRWCAVADGASPSACLATVFRESEARLAFCGVREVWCIVHPSDWIKPYLRDLGYRIAERLLTYEIEPRRAPDASPFLAGLQVRPAQVADLDALCALDARAFDEPWRYPPVLMRRAVEHAFATTVALLGGALAGYACAVLHEQNGHVVRLAVQPALRRRGIGAGLLLDIVARLARAGAQVVSLNTQASNRTAQRLYRRLGFAPVDEKLPVMRKVLAPEAGGGIA